MPEDLSALDRPATVRHAEPEHAGVVLVDWMLGNSCNYACSYCPSALHDGSIRWQAATDILRFLDVLRRHYCGTLGRQVWLQFTGGEPSQHPRIDTILAEARARGFRSSLISNGGRTLRFWDRIAPLLDGMILTYHDEFADHARFLDLAVLLAEAMPLHINITIHPDRFDAILARALEISETVPLASISLKPLRIGFGTDPYAYTDDQRARMQAASRGAGPRGTTAPRGVMCAIAEDGRHAVQKAAAFLLTGRNRWHGYLCEAGIESLRVHADGRILRATCGVGGTLGRLGGPVDLPLSPVLCDRDACGCVADILITKRDIGALNRATGLA
ncbi:radical SAM protein [Rhodovulum euryhalinum]|uniref:MoaA/NifB/PqqE/SkfB family radical SAM enzyme n=1 Tax=Rhodovulum euryhalinum TaxID=35805 RepID=A0A4R2KI40_9RHOB|nr:radical SAM protein [Rhodovulum euryhalinum]TCO72037.1 MoaA/NifB/PqqE/SkfB family radical SAM enzyme [Rhodovulum euryhalinum]